LVDSKNNAVALSDFGSWGVVVIKQGTTIEIIKFDTLTQNATNCTLGVATSGRNLNPTSPYAGSSTGSAFQSGAEVIVTNDPYTMSQFGNLNNAQTWAALQTFSVAPVSSVDAVGSTELVRKSQLDAAILGSLTNAPVVIPGTAGETLLVDQEVYLKTSDGLWYKTDADTASTIDNVLLGITRGGGTIGGAISNGVTILGEHVAASAIFTANTLYYASNTAGGFSSSAGTTEVVVGFASSTTKIYFSPRYNTTLTAIQKSQVSQLVAGTDFYGASATGTDSYAITPTPAITAYAAGMRFRFKTDVANTGAATLAVSGLSAITIKKLHDQDLATGDIEAGQIVDVVYDGTNFQMQSGVATAYALSTSLKFGGTGADGALAISSGTTTLDLGGAQVFTKNYTSISITGTGKLAFSNPHANGTIIKLLSQGDVTLTSSQAPMIDASGMGAQDKADGTLIMDTSSHIGGDGSTGTTANPGVGGAAGTAGASITVNESLYTTTSLQLERRNIMVACGSGGADGAAGAAGFGGAGGVGGAGGRGGGVLIIECAGAWNFTTASGISVAGAAGSNGTAAGAGTNGGGGGGGSGGRGGFFIALYNTLTASSGTVTVSGGAAGTGGAGGTGGVANTGGGGGGAGCAGGVSSAGNAGAAGSNGNAGTGTGGAGGNGGAGLTGYSVVAKNVWFA
jgi:hypothetical protein